MNRQLRLFYLFRLLATSYLWAPFFIFYMKDRGLSFQQVTWLGSLFCVVVIAVEIPTGALADRLGRRGSMMAGSLAMVASCLVAWNAHGFAAFAVAEILAALSLCLCSGADSAYLYDLLAAEGRAEEYPHRESVASGWHLAGAATSYAVGGLLAELDLGLTYLATAGLSGLAFLTALALRSEPVRRPAGDRRAELAAYLATMRESVRDVARSGRLLWVMAYSALVFVLVRATSYIHQPYLDSRGFGLVAIGVVFAGVHLFAAAVAFRGDGLRRLFGERFLVWAMLAVLAGSFVLLDRLAGSWALGGLAVQAIAFGLYSPLVKPMLNREIVDSGRRATVLSIESIARRAAMAVFSPLVGMFSAGAAIALCAVTGFVGLALLAALARWSPAARPIWAPAARADAAAGRVADPLGRPAAEGK